MSEISAKERVAREIRTMLLGPAGENESVDREIMRVLDRPETIAALAAEQMSESELAELDSLRDWMGEDKEYAFFRMVLDAAEKGEGDDARRSG